MHGLKANNSGKQRTLPCLSVLLVACLLGLADTGCKPLQDRIDQFRDVSRMRALASLDPIDAHTHIGKSGPQFLAMLDRLHMHVLDILYVDDTNESHASLDQQRRDALDFIASSHGRASLCTTFDPFLIDDADFADSAIRALNADFQRGAVAVKVWKNVGMELKDRSGRFVFPDDRRFLPIYEDITKYGKTLIIHAADPEGAWNPAARLDPLHGYYVTNTQWDMSRKPDAPKIPEIFQARDQILKADPKLRVIGAHFCNMTEHLEELGTLLDLYPNLAVDTAAHLPRLITQSPDKVRAFLLRYQDRIIYGTDLSFSAGDDDSLAARLWERQYKLEWRYLSTADNFEYRGHKTKGLYLPHSVLQKIYHDNAVRWIPGINRDLRFAN